MPYDEQLADRIRHALTGQPAVREVAMFGGLSFMVDDKLSVAADSHGRLMVRCDPDRVDELLERPGASWPEMRGKPMSRGWIVVDDSGTGSDEDLAWWIGRALDHLTA
ncbi:TfoX/Sxy family protein [Nocardioides sp. InS609-2]|uniref:TfoX/Sxy family protein n=1 Tax=Nocardioides sp. InS609-2 TaxID=2760705 RepID=UPI0017D8BA3C|nr:TfoX/Sxy family protein [Nocardioides sp. InS609-2]MBA3783768.1 TfoX/Sxy family protein [Nocardioides sp.]